MSKIQDNSQISLLSDYYFYVKILMIICSIICWSPIHCWILQDYCFLNRQMIKFFKKYHWHADNHLFSVLPYEKVMHPKIVSDDMLLWNHGSERLPSSSSSYRHLWNWYCPPCRQMLTSGDFSETVKQSIYISVYFIFFLEYTMS